jgi:DNA-binding PadR family transcriptional regulator
MRTDGVKGHLELLMLSVLSEGDGHGYAVITALRQRSAGAFDLAEGAVYPALHRLEQDGLVSSEWTQVGGRRRRTYRLTDLGVTALAAKRREWRTLAGAVDAVLAAAPRARMA